MAIVLNSKNSQPLRYTFGQFPDLLRVSLENNAFCLKDR